MEVCGGVKALRQRTGWNDCYAVIAAGGDCLLTPQSLPCCGYPGEGYFRRPNSEFCMYC